MNGYMRYALNNSWRRSAGLPELADPPSLLDIGGFPSLNKLRATQRSFDFEELSRERKTYSLETPLNLSEDRELVDLFSDRFKELHSIRIDRKVMGAMRYGLMGDKTKPKWDRIPSCIERLKKYQETGDVGLLADVANLCELEYVEGDHPNRHLATGDSKENEHVSIEEKVDEIMETK